MPAEWQIYLDGLEFYGYHGVPDEEQVVGHRYRLRVEIEFDGPKNPGADDIRQTVDYSKVAALAVDIGTNKRFKTLEALAWSMGNSMLEKFLLIDAVTLTLEKALPPMPVIAEAAGVTLRVER